MTHTSQPGTEHVEKVREVECGVRLLDHLLHLLRVRILACAAIKTSTSVSFSLLKLLNYTLVCFEFYRDLNSQ